MKATNYLRDLLYLAIIGAAAAVLALPMILYGPFPEAHDVYEHLTFNLHFSEQFWAGEFYPRWLAGMNHGLGSPSFFVFPPFQAYVYALLVPLCTAVHLNAFMVEEFLVLFASGICAFLWLRTIAKRQVALAAAILYMLAPYHLSIDFYRRNALPECWALAWMPLILFCTFAIVNRKRAALVSFAVAFALMILSHLVSVAIFALIPLATAYFLSARNQRLWSISRVIYGMLLGTGLSCFYLIPALAHAHNFPPARFIKPTPLFLITAQDLSRKFQGLPYFHAVAIVGLDALAVCGICGAALLMKGRPESKRRAIFWLAICSIPAFMMCGPSLALWRRWPMLFSAVQYPYRLNILLCLANAALLAIVLSKSAWMPGFAAAAQVVLVLLVVLPWGFSYWNNWGLYRGLNATGVLVSREDGPFEQDGWFLAWSVPGLDEASAIRASTGPRARFTSGAGSTSIIRWAPRDIEIETTSSTGGQVTINQFFYPSWQATLLRSAKPVETSAAMPEGLLQVQAPPGNNRIQIALPIGAAERAGRWISIGCVLLCMALLWMEMRNRGVAGKRLEAENKLAALR